MILQWIASILVLNFHVSIRDTWLHSPSLIWYAIANISVMYVLIKTNQMTNITCKLIFVLSKSDLMIGVFVQNLFMASFYERNCLLQKILRFFSLFLTHFSCYIITILGIDRYIRIKYFTKFKTIWTKKVVINWCA